MKYMSIIIFALMGFINVAHANGNVGITLTNYEQPKSDLAVAFQEEASKLKGISSKKLLMLEVYEGFQFNKVDLSDYGSILLIGESKDVESAMMELLGFGISANTVVLDNIHGDLVVKLRRKTDFESETKFANRLLNMML